MCSVAGYALQPSVVNMWMGIEEKVKKNLCFIDEKSKRREKLEIAVNVGCTQMSVEHAHTHMDARQQDLLNSSVTQVHVQRVRVTIRVDHRTGKLGGRSPTILHFYC
jgi:hypothetical protein